MGRQGVIGTASVCAAALTLLLAGQAWAAPIAVETTADATVNDMECSLREALTSANTNSNTLEPGCAAGEPSSLDIINLPAGSYTLLGAAGDDLNATGDLDYTGGGFLAIQGPGNATGVPSATIDAPASDRIIDVPAPTGPQRLLQLFNLSLTDGRALGALADGDGGAIRAAVPNVDLQISSSRVTGSQAGRNGGAVSYDSADVFGNLQVDFSEFSGNTAGGSGGAFWSGVADNDPMINASTLAGNHADGAGGGLAMKASDAAKITFRNSTLSGNSADGGGSAVGYSDMGLAATSLFQFSTVAGNTSPAAHPAIEGTSAGHDFFLRGSIISGNTGAGVASNCATPGRFISQGYNVESANTCSLIEGNPDLFNTDPLLAPLVTSTLAGAQQTTRTRGLYDESPAVDFIPRDPLDKCQFTDDQDQRGIARPAAPNGLCDAGAFEGTVGPKPVPPTTNPPPAPPAKTSPAKKKCKKGRKLKQGKCVKKRRNKRR